MAQGGDRSRGPRAATRVRRSKSAAAELSLRAKDRWKPCRSSFWNRRSQSQSLAQNAYVAVLRLQWAGSIVLDALGEGAVDQFQIAFIPHVVAAVHPEVLLLIIAREIQGDALADGQPG